MQPLPGEPSVSLGFHKSPEKKFAHAQSNDPPGGGSNLAGECPSTTMAATGCDGCRDDEIPGSTF